MGQSRHPLPHLKDWRYEVDFEGIAWAWLDRAGESNNTLGAQALGELGEIIEAVQADIAAGTPPRGLIIISAKDVNFIVGADIREFDAFQSEAEVTAGVERVTAMLDQLEALKVPTVAAIHGYCLGGGTELAFACDYRIMDRGDATRLALPEVKLGIFPGFNGTARALKLGGAANAMDMMLTGRMLRPSAAKGMGFIDQLVDSKHQLRWTARKAVLQKRRSKPETRANKLLRTWPVRGQVAATVHKKTAAKANPEHYPAPFALIKLFQKFGGNLKRMKTAETRAFAPLMVSDTARNLRRVFRVSEEMKGLAPKGVAKPRRAHIIGAGTMGADIAAWCVVSGMEVSLQDLSPEALEKAKAGSEKLFKKRLKTTNAVKAAMARFHLDPEGKMVNRADVVIEAIVERLDVKQSVFQALEPRLKPGAILASNTSSLPIEDIAAGLSDPGRLIGLHFFNPVAQLPLVEVVRSPLSRQDEVDKGCAFVTAISKFPLVTKSTAGFLVNRVLAPYMMSAIQRFEAGDERDRIDAAAKDFGMPMGPLELADQVGLDICMSVAETLQLETGGQDGRAAQLVAKGHLGKKSGQGFYTWKDGKPERGEAPKYAKGELAKLGRELVDPLIDECEKCLAEGVVETADLVDGGVIFGTGFAPFRGGPLHYRASMSGAGNAPTAAAAAAE